MAKWARAGCDVHLVVCTDGGRGTLDPEADDAALIARRAAEVAEAAGVIGVVSHRFLGAPTADSENDGTLRAELVRCIRQLRPGPCWPMTRRRSFSDVSTSITATTARLAGPSSTPSRRPPRYPGTSPTPVPPSRSPPSTSRGPSSPTPGWTSARPSASRSPPWPVIGASSPRTTAGRRRWSANGPKRRAARAGVAYAEGFRSLRFGG